MMGQPGWWREPPDSLDTWVTIIVLATLALMSAWELGRYMIT